MIHKIASISIKNNKKSQHVDNKNHLVMWRCYDNSKINLRSIVCRKQHMHHQMMYYVINLKKNKTHNASTEEIVKFVTIFRNGFFFIHVQGYVHNGVCYIIMWIIVSQYIPFFSLETYLILWILSHSTDWKTLFVSLKWFFMYVHLYVWHSNIYTVN